MNLMREAFREDQGATGGEDQDEVEIITVPAGTLKRVPRQTRAQTRAAAPVSSRTRARVVAGA